MGRSVRKIQESVYEARRAIRRKLTLYYIGINTHIKLLRHDLENKQFEDEMIMLDEQINIWLELHNCGYQDVANMGVHVRIGKNDLGQQIVSIPVGSKVEVRGFSTWIARLGRHVVNVALNMGGKVKESQKEFMVVEGKRGQ